MAYLSAFARPLKIAACLLAIGTPAGLAAQGEGPFKVEGGRSYAKLADAVGAIGAGSGTILIAPGTYRQCAAQDAGAITYRAVTPGTVTFERVTCEDKAGLVLRGRAARVEGLIFQGYAVPDGNGAGIRLERGDLDVVQSWFRDSEEGILTSGGEQGTVSVDRSTFTRLGRCDRDLECAHSIYVGHYGLVRVTRSRFEAGRGGHYVKSRAARADLRENSFDDSQGHLTNYMIDLPAGASGTIENNVMVQGRDKDNYSAFIALGAEGGGNSSNGLVVRNNVARFVPGLARNSTFLADWTGARLVMDGNALASGIKPRDQR
jgi:hypothetical protein